MSFIYPNILLHIQTIDNNVIFMYISVLHLSQNLFRLNRADNNNSVSTKQQFDAKDNIYPHLSSQRQWIISKNKRGFVKLGNTHFIPRATLLKSNKKSKSEPNPLEITSRSSTYKGMFVNCKSPIPEINTQTYNGPLPFLTGLIIYYSANELIFLRFF